MERFRWLLVAIDQTTVGILDFFLEWRRHRLDLRQGLKGSRIRHYYRTAGFDADFLAFVRWHLAGKHPAVEVFLDYEDSLRRAVSTEESVQPIGDLLAPGNRLRWSDVPVRRERATPFELSCDIQRVVDALKVRTEPVWIRGPHFYMQREVSPGTYRVEQISNWMVSVLRTCDGRHTVADIVERLSLDIQEVEEPLREHVFVRLLEGAQAKGLIQIYRLVTGPVKSYGAAESGSACHSDVDEHNA